MFNFIMKFCFFDWGSTLARQNTRHIFVDPNVSPYQKMKLLMPNAFQILLFLHSQNIALGLISNMEKDIHLMNVSLREIGLYDLFDVIVYSNEKNMCKKPCRRIFQTAFNRAISIYPNLKPEQVLYVGNSFDKDFYPIIEYYPLVNVILINKNFQRATYKNGIIVHHLDEILDWI